MNHVSHSVSLGTIIKFFAVGIVCWLLYYLRDIVLVVITAIVLAAAAEPAVRRLMQYKIPRGFSVLGVYFVAIAVFTTIGYFFIPAFLGETVNLANDLPKYANSNNAIHFNAPILGDVSTAELASRLQNLFINASDDPFGALSAIFGGVTQLLLVIVFSFYFAVYERGIVDFLRIITPRQHEAYVVNLWDRTKRKIGLWMQGQLLLGLLVGVLSFLGLTILGVQYALVLSILAAVFELIPLFGPLLSAVPAVAIAYAAGGIPLALAVVVLFIVIQQFENHLIYPLVVTKVVGVPPVLVILALVVGLKLAGFFGVLLAVPAAALLQEIFSDIDKQRHPQE
jgi:predicted PurR-regulated permease PerM